MVLIAKKKKDEESKKDKKIWPKSEVLNLIALRGEIEFEFAKPFNPPPPTPHPPKVKCFIPTSGSLF